MGKLLKLLRGEAAPAGGPRRVQGHMVELTIVGESGYQDYIRHVAQQARGGGFEIVLRPDPQNPFDSSAVVVLVDGRTDGRPVGYLPREMARVWQPALFSAEAEGFFVVGTAQVLGGTRDKPNVGVFGSAPWPGQSPPAGRWG